MFQDLQRNADLLKIRSPRLIQYALTFGTVRYQAVWLYRVSAEAGQISPLLGHFFKQMNHFLTGADISWQCRIGRNLILFHPSGVVIGSGVIIGSDCQIQQGVTLGNSARPGTDSDNPILGQHVYIGAGARVIGAVRIGNGVTIGANAVVLSDVEDYSTAVGVPAKAVPNRSEQI